MQLQDFTLQIACFQCTFWNCTQSFATYSREVEKISAEEENWHFQTRITSVSH